MGKKEVTKKQKIAEKKAKKVVESSSEDESSSEEEVEVISKKQTKVQAKAAQKKAKKVVEESSSEDSDSSETPVVKSKKAAPAKKVAKKVESSSDDSDSESEEEVKPTKKAAPAKKAAKKVESSSEESSSEDEKPAPKKAAPAKKAAKKAESSSEEDSDEESEEAKPAAKKAAAKEESSSDEEESEEKEEKEEPKKEEVKQDTPQLQQNNGKWEAMVRGLSYDADENDIGNWFEEAQASVESVKLLRDRETQRSRGMAFVVFEQMEGLVKAIELSGSEHMGRTIFISNSADKREKPNFAQQASTQAVGDNCTIFVGNLTYGCNEDQLKEFFADCGEIQGARIAKEKETQKSRGFGHVDFASPDGVKAALKKAGSDFQGRPVKVDVAAARQGGNRGGAPQRGGRGGAQLSSNDKAAKKGNIVAFQGAKVAL